MFTIGAVSAHLQAHVDAEHDVPDYAIAEVEAEVVERGADWDGYG